MTRSRHKAVRKRPLLGTPFRRFGLPVAALAAAAAVATFAIQRDTDDATPSAQPDTTTSSTDDSTSRIPGAVSRGEERTDLPSADAPGGQHNDGAGSLEAVAPERTGSMFVTTELNLRTGPGEQFDVLDTLPTGEKIAVTDTTDGPWTQVLYDGEPLWVTGEYLSEKKPAETATISGEPCTSGSEVESGLMPGAILVHRAVCAEFPEVTAYGGLRPGDDGEHGTGQALDIMISGATGDEIADFVRSNASDLGVSEVLWEQHIWTVERSAEGWRPMEDRGSTTANHYDHVHVTVYGDSA